MHRHDLIGISDRSTCDRHDQHQGTVGPFRVQQEQRAQGLEVSEPVGNRYIKEP